MQNPKQKDAAANLAQVLAAKPGLLEDALDYARRQLRGRAFQTLRHLSAEDLVNDAVLGILDGHRSFGDAVSIAVLRSIINSRVWAERCKGANRVTVSAADLHPSLLDRITDGAGSADQMIERDEDQRCRRWAVKVFRCQIADDHDLLRFADAVLAGANTPREIASYLNAPPASVRTVQKRFARQAKRFRAEYPWLFGSLQSDREVPAGSCPIAALRASTA
jgi:hypothetical protein